MAITIRSLARTRLADSEGDLYSPGEGKVSLISSIRLVNTSGSAVTVDLFIKRGSGTSYHIIEKGLSLAAGAAHIDDSEIALEGSTEDGSDALRGKANTANVVDCVISGIEREL